MEEEEAVKSLEQPVALGAEEEVVEQQTMVVVG